MNGPYTANLSKIDIPVLYIGVAGGMGKLGEYAMQLLRSKDVSITFTLTAFEAGSGLWPNFQNLLGRLTCFGQESASLEL
jgi:hypothetical protein